MIDREVELLQTPLRCYPIEAIGPMSGTTDGLYLAGGAYSGNIYIWKISDGKLIKNWHAHHTSLTCLMFSADDSRLISGSEDGVIIIWPSISVVDRTDCGSPPVLSFLSDHASSITGLLTSSITSSVFISSSLDCTCKVWDLGTGKLRQTRAFPRPITAIAFDALESLLFCGSADGRIFVNLLHLGLAEKPLDVFDPIVLNEHRGSITALTFCGLGLVSTSEDCTVCIWDVVNCVVIKKFINLNGPLTNLAVIPQSSLLTPMANYGSASDQFCVPSLDKHPLPADPPLRETTLPQQSYSSERAKTIEEIQIKIKESIEQRAWAQRMTDHVLEMNNQVESRFLDTSGRRLLSFSDVDSPINPTKLKIESLTLEEEEEVQSMEVEENQFPAAEKSFGIGNSFF